MKTTREVTEYLDQFVIGQHPAKQAIAVAYRERALRMNNTGDQWKYVVPNNILMIGPSGTGKTEIARQLAELTDAPFIKVEITEFTQVGYFGRDVKTILTDLVNEAIRIAPSIWRDQQSNGASDELMAFLEKIFLNYKTDVATHLKVDPATLTFADVTNAFASGKFKKLALPATIYLDGMLDELDATTDNRKSLVDKVLQEMGLAWNEKRGQSSGKAVCYLNFLTVCINEGTLADEKASDFLQTVIPADAYKKLQQRAKSKLTDTKVRGVFVVYPESTLKEFAEKLGAWNRMYFTDLVKQLKKKSPDLDEVPDSFIVKLVEERGIVFIDEIDKIFVDTAGGNVGNIGVVRDLLPYLDGVTMDVPIIGERDAYYTNRSNRSDKVYRINTANILWIASGAFNIAKVSDVPAEILGRLPVHVKLAPLDIDALYGILTKPHGSVLSRLQLVMEAEGLDFKITPEAIRAMATLAYNCNQKGEDIGARRLTNISSVLFDELRFDASNMEEGSSVVVDQKFIDKRAKAILDTVPPRVPRFKEPAVTPSTVLMDLAKTIANEIKSAK